jgi:hypothetical protein
VASIRLDHPPLYRPRSRALQALGAEALMVEGRVGQHVSAALDQGLGAYPLRDMLELASGRRTATQGQSTISGQYSINKVRQQKQQS